MLPAPVLRPASPAPAILLALVALAWLLAAPAARAAPTTMSVTNLGQNGSPSSVLQPAVVAKVRGACELLRAVSEANGTASSCPGVWPEQGSDAWFAPEPVAAIWGDTLRLVFDQPVTNVFASATTAHPVGLTTPCATPAPGSPATNCPAGGRPVPNTGTELGANLWTEGGTSWQLTGLSGAASGRSGPLQIAISTTSDSGGAAFTIGARGPRPFVFGAACGPAWIEPSTRVDTCTAGGGPAKGAVPPVGTATTAEPAITFAKSPALKGRALKVVVTPTVAGSLTLRLRSGTRTLMQKTVVVKTAGKVSRTFSLSGALRRKLARSPSRRYTLTVELAAGVKSASASTKVRWRR